MIYEIRTYTLHPRTTEDFEKRWGAAYPVRAKHSPIAGFFHTEFGPLNEVIHIWPYADLNERNRLRAEANKEEGWPPDVSEFIVNQKVEVLTPFGFAPEWTPGADGPYYELRQYTFRPGSLPQIMQNWRESLPERMKFSSPCLLGAVEMGPTANSFIHLWAYKSLEQRDQVRAGASATGVWPPAGGREYYTAQQNKLLLPASFSPAQ
jgi:NIPSNAP protein